MDSLKQDQSVGRLTNSTACPTCHGLDRSKVDPKKLTRFHALRQTESWSLAVSFDELAVGSTSGCQFCDILIQTFEHYWKNSTTSLHTSNPSVTLSVPLKENLDLAASFDAPNPRPFYAGVEELAIDVVLTTPEKYLSLPFSALRVGGYVPISPKTDSCFLQVSKWLQDCLNEHSCEFGVDSFHKRSRIFIGARLIAVPAEGEEARLLDNNDVPWESPWVALSYCWGKANVLTTTKATLEDRKRGIPWNLFPQTLQDAFLLTHALHIPYIWIDALCIIQDDSDDWANEVTRMESIYAQATLVIAAESSSDSNGGLFTDRSATLDFISKSHDQLNRVYVQRRVSHNLKSYPPSILDGNRWPLSTRGWALQERLLAARILHFAADEMMWQCRGCLHCECKYLDVVPEELAVSIRSLSYGSVIPAALDKDNDALAASWCELVQMYTNRSLTLDTDRLPAISGLAWDYGNRGLGKYRAGTWNKYLLKMLDWQSIGFGTMSHRRPSSYIAPTWSWASVIGPIAWDLRDGHVTDTVSIDNSIYVANVLDVVCTRGRMECFGHGQVEDGFLTIRSPTLTTNIRNSGDGDFTLTCPARSKVFLDVPIIAGSCEVDDGELVKCLFLENPLRKPNTAIILRSSRRRPEEIKRLVENCASWPSPREVRGPFFEKVGRLWVHNEEELPELPIETLTIL